MGAHLSNHGPCRTGHNRRVAVDTLRTRTHAIPRELKAAGDFMVEVSLALS
jgi:hypothetical protein